jgi:hypothetical protein
MIYRAHAIGTIQEKKSPWEGWLHFLVSQKRIASHEVNFQLNNYLLPEVCPLLSVVLHVSLLALWYCKFWELWDMYLVLKRIWNPIDFQGHRVKCLPHNILVNIRINILQWILTKLGTYLVLKKIWNPIDFQGQRSRSGDLDLWPWKSIGFQTLLRIKYVPSLVKIHWRMLILEWSQGGYGRTVALLYPFATSLARG